MRRTGEKNEEIFPSDVRKAQNEKMEAKALLQLAIVM
jgi:hypothetical protein